MPQNFDLIIRGGIVYDGTGSDGERADIGVNSYRIALVGDASSAEAAITIDARDHAVAPGFIDVHAHDDALIFEEPNMIGKSMQGVTTVINGNCGSGVVPMSVSRRTAEAGVLPQWDSYSEYFAAIEHQPPSINAASLVGYGTLRAGALGSPAESRAPAEGELAQMRAWLRDGLEAGAVGLSTGLIYEPGRYSTTDQIVELARECADYGALYTSHVRGEGETLLEAHAEAIEIGRRAGIRVQISHHKASGKPFWGRVHDSLAQIEAARAAGDDVTADQYPYTAGSTRLFAIIQNGWFAGGDGDAELEGADVRLASVPGHPEWEGLNIEQLQDRWDLPTDQAAQRVVDEAGDAVIAILFSMAEDDVRTVLQHPSTMIGTDGIGWGSKPHPRHFGSYPRILGHYVRDEGLLTLPEAIHKMTGMAAAKFDLPGRGAIREGALADLVVFDPAAVAERSSYDEPRQAPRGMPHVIVNGVPVVRDGVHTQARAGRVVRRGIDA